MRSRTCSRLSSVVSRITAPGAGSSGECPRVRSRSSRIVCSASTRPGSAPSSAERRRARSVASAVRKTLTSASGATTVPISRPSATQPAAREQPPLLGDHRLADERVRGGPRRGLGDGGRADLLGHVAPVEQHPVAELDPHVRGELGRLAPLRARRERHGPVHRSGVEVGEAELACERPCDRRFARSRGPVDRHHHRHGPASVETSSTKFGYDTAAASIPTTSTPSRDARPATAPSSARR